ncbi:pyridoxamine 5'-phosphate oxidase family protein [Novosphingobium sp. TCA1]|uniref:pyridoxamine 5'-phosphate oxidase family protein n=1 Tax=Novosphingobium sp. TCA1 TaxID=2682474 RepID=UPI00130BC1DF|nr:pyridoxamine 5'-phosphate oxidase family protein [Novosphingobium sp. TCA1]GFE73634.1 general stress protein [Novosphingobium sp. TCA1]
MESHVRERFWKAFAASPFMMIKLDAAHGHAEPMTALLDKEAHHAVWFFCKRDNRIGGGGRAMGQVMTKGHDVFACLAGTLVEETDPAVRERHWSNAVEAWFPKGKADPSIVMLRFEVDDAEVWTSDVGITGLFKLATGGTIDPSRAGEHEVGAV